MTVVTVSRKGWVVIPAELRRKYGLTPGSRVRVVDYGSGVTLMPLLEDPVREAFGMFAGKTSLTAALLAEKAKDRERE